MENWIFQNISIYRFSRLQPHFRWFVVHDPYNVGVHVLKNEGFLWCNDTEWDWLSNFKGEKGSYSLIIIIDSHHHHHHHHHHHYHYVFRSLWCNWRQPKNQHLSSAQRIIWNPLALQQEKVFNPCRLGATQVQEIKGRSWVDKSSVKRNFPANQPASTCWHA